MKTLIRGGTVFDGTGADGFSADILIENDKIAAIEKDIKAEDVLIIDAAGAAVTPGFVDIHRHCDVAVLTAKDFGEIELKQGITTTAVGNCGLAPLPSGDDSRAEMYDFLEPVVGKIPLDMRFNSYNAYLDALKAVKFPLNMGFFAAAGAIKTAIKGFSGAPYTAAELKRAAELVREAMLAGAMGVSLGIMYQPEMYSTIDELASVVKPAARFGGVLCTHIRGEGDSLVQSVEEVIRIAEIADMPLNISHFKATGLKNWHDKIYKAIETIELARSKGHSVTADFYPYDGGSSTIQSLLPPSLLKDGNNAMIKSLETKSGRDFLRDEIYKKHVNWDNMALSIGWDRIIISSVSLPEHLNYSEKSIAELAEKLGVSDPADVVAHLLLTEGGKTGIIVRSMSQNDIDEIARLPWSFLISDALYGGGKNPHPRLYGAFPKFLREYVRERRILTFPKAVNKMTEMPAKRVGITDRGKLKPGCKADISVFDPEKFTDRATYADSRQLAAGMEYVLINGEIAIQAEKLENREGGEILRLHSKTT